VKELVFGIVLVPMKFALQDADADNRIVDAAQSLIEPLLRAGSRERLHIDEFERSELDGGVDRILCFGSHLSNLLPCHRSNGQRPYMTKDLVGNGMSESAAQGRGRRRPFRCLLLRKEMSVFTNPASRSIEQAREYTVAVLDLLGSSDPMGVLRSTPDGVRNAVAGLTERELSQPEPAGKWPIRHVVRHL